MAGRHFSGLEYSMKTMYNGASMVLVPEDLSDSATIEKAKKLGYGAILFFGRPEYYPQFGFKEASEFGVADAEGYNYPSFMGMELIPGYLKEATGGRYFESDIYNDELNRECVKAFDEQFMMKEK